MPFTPQQLYTEITTDPTNIGYASSWNSGNDLQTAALLNAVNNLTLLQPISMVTFAKLVSHNGIRQKLKNGQSNATTGAICDTAIDMLAELTIPFDPTDTLTQALMADLETAGIITSGDIATVTAACTLPCSRAQYLWGYQTVIQPSDIGAARRAG